MNETVCWKIVTATTIVVRELTNFILYIHHHGAGIQVIQLIYFRNLALLNLCIH